jgi:hypothetical protein
MSIWTDINASWSFFRSLRNEGNIPDDYVLDGLPPPKPDPELVDDWEEVKGDWIEVEMCHCGYKRGGHYTKVCPRCGHQDRWFNEVVRDEWEFSRSRESPYDRFVPPSFRASVRNYHTRKWTPEDCPVKEV